jgi:putative FmdB family regulatory protein
MAAYEYGCTDCGSFTKVLPLGTARPVCLCPACGAEARRIWSTPFLIGGPGPVRSLRVAAERSADAPVVVRRVPEHADAPAAPKRYGPGAQALPRP